MTIITTKRILADKALQKNCGQECVDWAIHLLEMEHDGDYLARLAGMLPLYNLFEIADMRDQVLRELGCPDSQLDDALRQYSVEVLKSALNGPSEWPNALAIVKDLCVANDYQRFLPTVLCKLRFAKER